jgi:hypothetical protein
MLVMLGDSEFVSDLMLVLMSLVMSAVLMMSPLTGCRNEPVIEASDMPSGSQAHMPQMQAHIGVL